VWPFLCVDQKVWSSDGLGLPLLIGMRHVLLSGKVDQLDGIEVPDRAAQIIEELDDVESLLGCPDLIDDEETGTGVAAQAPAPAQSGVATASPYARTRLSCVAGEIRAFKERGPMRFARS
jgi:hypothetical protein